VTTSFIGWCWTAFLVVWLVTALRTKRTRTAESFVGQLPYRVITVLGALLIFDNRFSVGVLATPIIPWTSALYDIGAALTVLGILFAFWARFHLGRNWSGNVTIKTDHELVRTGPYARIRHPIYTGILLAVFGTGLAIDAWRAVLGFVLVLAGFWLKARREESILEREFGGRFADHVRATGMFVPRVF
jgi:protein-S-isoprenylcysteine O-methyltransferase Ste14